VGHAVKGQYRIDSLWAFTCIDSDGTEGVAGALIPKLGFVPLVGADLARIASMRPYAQQVATATGRPVTLSHFSVRTNQETIQP
jgi:hypothetical protein